MGKSLRLRIDDIDPVYRLVGECRELWADADAWQDHLIRGACRLTRSVIGHYNEQRLAPNLTSTEILDETFGGSFRDADQRDRYLQLNAGPVNRTSFFPRCTRLAGVALIAGQSTALRGDIRPNNEWYRSPIFNDVFRPAHLDGFVMSFSLNAQTGSLVMLITNQDASDPAPTSREQAIVALLMRQIAPLVGTSLATRAQNGLRGLSPRLRQTLDRLLAGESEKEVARQMELHPATVHEYVGDLYRRFGVDSRAELMAYFIARRPGPLHGAPTAPPPPARYKHARSHRVSRRGA